MSNSLLYTEKQATEATQLSRSTLRRLEQAGKLRSIRVGRAVRYLPSELARFVESLDTEQADVVNAQTGPHCV